MGVPKHGRCRRGIRPYVGSVGRPNAGLKGERQCFWSAIARGMSTETAAAFASVSAAVGARWFRQGGGMSKLNLTEPSDRYLSLSEREEIALLRVQNLGVREIARRVGRHPATISRELKRNAATRGGYVEYRATTAHWHAQRRAQRPKVAKLAANPILRQYVQARLAGLITTESGKRVGPIKQWSGRRHGQRQDRNWAVSWSPQQISQRSRIDFPQDDSMRISHEAIYQALYIQNRGALNRDLCMCLRSGRPLRVPRARIQRRGKSFVTDDSLIGHRPSNIEDRLEVGHWEGDLILGVDSSAIGTLVERSTRYTMLLHLPRMPDHGEARHKHGPALAGHGAQAVRNAITAAMTRLPESMRRSLTWDQGAEMAQHIQLTRDTGMRVFFCDPRSPWQRGTNENTNGLLRQYFPKGTDLSRHGQQTLAAVADTLNNRPRKVLGWRTPAEEMNVQLSSRY
ncbi:MAG TPA: IS30 family transposase [Burkholderiales bacterium]|nr:IS30 family transposase [Burkholderiales bacterium]